MAGAIALSATATVKSGAGLVTVAVPDRCLETVASFDPTYMTVPLADDQHGRVSAAAKERLEELAEGADAIGIGPGLSVTPDIVDLVLELYRRYAKPMVVDADALNALASLPIDLPMPGGERILTPHIGEFRRLIDEDRSVESCRARASDFAAEAGVVVVLKGHRSLITDGHSLHENTTGNPGMATGGAGDVLTGVITALLGQGLPSMEAAVLGAHVHGVAGDHACEQLGEVSMSATDICDSLAFAFQATSEEVIEASNDDELAPEYLLRRKRH